MTKQEILDRIKYFESEFNEEEIVEVEVKLVKETDKYYVCDVTLIYIGDEGLEGMEITEGEYPKDIIDNLEM